MANYTVFTSKISVGTQVWQFVIQMVEYWLPWKPKRSGIFWSCWHRISPENLWTSGILGLREQTQAAPGSGLTEIQLSTFHTYGNPANLQEMDCVLWWQESGPKEYLESSMTLPAPQKEVLFAKSLCILTWMAMAQVRWSHFITRNCAGRGLRGGGAWSVGGLRGEGLQEWGGGVLHTPPPPPPKKKETWHLQNS